MRESRIKTEVLRVAQDDRNCCHPERSDREASPEGEDLGLESGKTKKARINTEILRAVKQPSG